MGFIATIREYLNDPIINMIVATVLGVVTTILIDKARERIKRLWWGVKNSTYEKNHFGKNGDFSVSQKGNTKRYKYTTRDLSICRFVFWSSGKELLQNNDVSIAAPLMITFDYRCDIVSIENIISSNPTIKLNIINLHQIIIYFEYLESGEGAVFDILYAGNDAHPDLHGIIKGGRINIKQMNPPDLSRKPRHRLLFGWLKPAQQIVAIRWFYTFSFILLFIFLFMLLTMLPVTLSSGNIDSKAWTILMTVRVIITLIIGAVMAIQLWQTAVVPQKLRRYYESIEKANRA